MLNSTEQLPSHQLRMHSSSCPLRNRLVGTQMLNSGWHSRHERQPLRLPRKPTDFLHLILRQLRQPGYIALGLSREPSHS